MILIADSGSTKANWCFVRKNGEKIFFHTEGYNPCFVSEEYIVQSMQNSIPPELDASEVSEVNFYGAGCYEENAEIISGAMTRLFRNSSTFVGSDLLAAARALLGKKPGFAAILGTGTNTGIYDGNRIILNIESLGYILGDEGSGCAIGKKLLVAYVRDYLPEKTKALFRERFGLTSFEIIDHMYSQPLANRFCAGFTPFVAENISITYLRELVKECFHEFFKNLVSHYPEFDRYSFNCIGSVAFVFRDILAEVAPAFHMEMGQIVKGPIEKLVDYHLEK